MRASTKWLRAASAAAGSDADGQGELFPDLLLIDGGKGQLNRALQAFAALQISRRRFSLAKREELVYVMQADGNSARPEPLKLSRRCYALRLLQYVRDEAHRFAQHYHHLLRRKKRWARRPSAAGGWRGARPHRSNVAKPPRPDDHQKRSIISWHVRIFGCALPGADSPDRIPDRGQ